ncbi:MAG: M48 family metallopeptidase [Ruminococcaceae bacterium]|nr:M48 family metallopeptidase [Oscillospiraceae bacterium]
MKIINVDGIDVFVVKKRIKNIYLRVKNNGEVFVSAPLFMNDYDIIDFVNSKEEWLEKTIEKVSSRNKKEQTFSEGEERFFWGRKYTLHTDTEKNKGYYFKGNDIVICVGKNSTVESRKKALADVYRDALSEIMPQMTEKCERISGISANEWRLKNMKTRWGSCNTKEGRIWLSVWLMEKPYEFIESVVYHELTHLRVKGHNKEFYELLLRYCPDYKNIQKKTKRQ